MTSLEHDLSIGRLPHLDLTRRQVLMRSPAWAASAALMLRMASERVAAQATPAAVDPDRLQQLTDLSRILCGGGNFDATRATNLLQLIAADPALEAGFEELLDTPPVDDQPIASETAQATAQVILIFWYSDFFAGEPLPDRSSAYYQLTAWQAMYTFSWAVCHVYGGWADAPQTGPLVPANEPAN